MTGGWVTARLSVLAAVVCLLEWPGGAAAQGRGGQQQGRGGASARADAPIDLTGYWVSVVTQDWRYRMVTPPKGDYGGIPITLAAKKVGDAWDPSRDEAAGEQCKAYGAPAIMHVPTRLRISWEGNDTLIVDTDAGMQTRRFQFGGVGRRSGSPGWQGESRAEWVRPRPARGVVPTGGSLTVVTNRLRPGYLRRNGVPYGADAVLTEHWDLYVERNGDQWIGITSVVEDSTYLREPWVAALSFKKEPDGSKWDPSPCSAR